VARSFAGVFGAARYAGDHTLLLRFDEATAGTNLADTAGGGAFSIVGSPGVTAPSYRPSYQETTGARAFNGSTQYATRASTAGQRADLSSAAFFFAAWIRPDTLGGLVFTHGANGETEAVNYLLQVSVISSGEVEFFWEHGSGVDVTATTTGMNLEVGVWAHVVGVREAPSGGNPAKCDLVVYKNGRFLQRFTDLRLPTGGGSGSYAIAARADGTGKFHGAIDDLQVGPWSPPAYAVRQQWSRYLRDWDAQNLLRTSRFSTSGFDLVDTAAPVRSCFTRVLVQRSIDEWVDLSLFFGLSFVESVEVESDLDAQGASATVQLLGRFHAVNLSPFVYDAGNEFNPINIDGEPLLQGNRRVLIETAVVPHGVTEAAVREIEAWDVEFEGVIVDVSVNGDRVSMRCMDMISVLQDTWIEPNPATGTEYQYGAALGTPIEGELGKIITDNDPARYRVLRFANDGTGGRWRITLLGGLVAQPGRPHDLEAGDLITLTGCANADGEHTVHSVDETTATLDTIPGGLPTSVGPANGFLHTPRGYPHGRPALWVPTSPLWQVLPWNQSLGTSVAGALQEAMAQIGWSCSYEWDDSRLYYRLKVWNPSAPSGFAGPYTVEERYAPSRAARRKDDVRNVCAVEYGESDSVDNLGHQRKYVAGAVDRSSIDRFGRRSARVGVASTSLINTAAEATELAERVVADLKAEDGEIEQPLPYDFYAQPGDVLYLYPEKDYGTPAFLSIDTASGQPVFEFGIKSRKIRLSRDERRQSLTLRDATTPAKKSRHFDVIQNDGFVPSVGVRPPSTPGTPTLFALGSRLVLVSWAHPPDVLNRKWDEMEIHASTSGAFFTASSSTLLGTVRGTSSTVRTAATGTYHFRLIARDSLANVGEAGPAASVSVF
jgi:hypothetical protein